MKLTLLSTSTIVLFFLASCQKDEMDKGGDGSGGFSVSQKSQTEHVTGISKIDSTQVDLD